MTKCAICKVETDRPKYCSERCGKKANAASCKANYYRVTGYYQLNHRVRRGCAGCGMVFRPHNSRNKFCSRSCAYSSRGVEAQECRIEKRVFKVQISDGKIKRRNPQVTLIFDGVPTSGQWAKVTRPYIQRDSSAEIDRAWEELQGMHDKAAEESNTDFFVRYLMNLSGG